MSKIASKIQFTTETQTDVLFGGGIGFDGKTGVTVNDNTGEKTIASKLALYQLYYPAEIGTPRRDDDVINPRSPQVNLVFTDPRSIDAVIEALNVTKNELEAAIEASKKERGERRNRNRNGRSRK